MQSLEIKEPPFCGFEKLVEKMDLISQASSDDGLT
jgi:hypothetical protein